MIFTVVSGTATLACGKSSCAVTASGDGRATMNVTPAGSTWSTVTASLTNGSTVKTEFVGGTPPALTALSPMLSLAAGATVTWTAQALVLNNGNPMSGQAVAWQATGGGIAAKALTVGPLTAAQLATSTACLNGSSQCVTFKVLGARPEYASLEAVSGTAQSLPLSGTPSLITLRVLDMNGNPMAGGTVTLYQALYAWAPPCASHTRCAPSTLLATQAGVATSALDGTVIISPASLPGVATNLHALAVTGNSGALNITVEQHP